MGQRAMCNLQLGNFQWGNGTMINVQSGNDQCAMGQWAIFNGAMGQWGNGAMVKFQ